LFVPSLNRYRGQSIVLGTYGNVLLPRKFRLGPTEIASHKHLIGLTGQGKSRLELLLFLELLAKGVGVSLMDPHSDLAKDGLKALINFGFFSRPGAYKRLIYVDFSTNRYIPFNILKSHRTSYDAAYDFLEAVKRAWPAIGDGSAPQLENILLAGSFLLAEAGQPITKMQELLTDKTFRDAVLLQAKDDYVRRFFTERYDRWGKGATQMVESTLRRVFLLTFSPALRYTLGQKENFLDFRRFMDEGISVIYDLGGIDNADARRLLGCLITVGYEMAALSRTDVTGGAKARRPHHLILDEFAEFVSHSEEALARMLALTRKYGLYLTLAHQTWSQASAKFRGALQNAGTEVVFKLGRADAEVTARALGKVDPYAIKEPAKSDRGRDLYMDLGSQWELWTQAIQRLRPREAFVRTSRQPTTRIRALNLPDPTCDPKELEEVLTTYAKMYQRPVSEITRQMSAPIIQNGAQKQPHFKSLWQEPDGAKKSTKR
jgi:hypothetical protein